MRLELAEKPSLLFLKLLCLLQYHLRLFLCGHNLVLFAESNGVHPLVPIPAHDISNFFKLLDLFTGQTDFASAWNASSLLDVLCDRFAFAFAQRFAIIGSARKG